MAALVFADLVQETTLSEGTGALTLGGAAPGHRAFADALTSGDRFYYSLSGAPAAAALFEVGIGTLANDGTIEREVIVSSDGTTLLDLPVGIKTISLTVAAEFHTEVSRELREGIALAPDVLDEFNQAERVIIDQPAPTGSMTNSAGGNDAVAIRFQRSITYSNNGPAGHVNYFNTVAGWGPNNTPSWTPLNTAMAAASYRIESKYRQNNVFAVEMHMAIWPTDAADEFRAFSTFVPHLKSTWKDKSSTSLRGGTIDFYDGLGFPRVQQDYRTGGGFIGLNDGGSGQGHPTLSFDTNNRVAARQRNAAGTSFLPLGYRNAQNNHHFEQGAIYLVTGTQATPSVTAAFAINCTSGAADQSAMNIGCPAITGNFSALEMNGSASAGLIQSLYNYGAGKAIYELQVLAGAGNDGVFSIAHFGGGQSWSVGMDNSDGDKLKIAAAFRDVGQASEIFVEFDAGAGKSRFYKPVNLTNAAGAAGELQVAGTKVIGARGSALPADATDLASAIALVNAMKARLVAHGLVAA